MNRDKYDDLEYCNNITKYMDSFIKLGENEFFRVYILDTGNNIYGIRYPGFTAGYIKVDENFVITDIGLYNNTLSTKMFSMISNQMIQDKFLNTKLDLSTKRK